MVVAAAGNGSLDLDRTNVDALNLWRNWGDSGAIIVGAGTPDIVHSRLALSNFGLRVDVQGWGQNVFSLGYGDFANLAPGDPNGKQMYTNTFHGTSSATAVVTGAIAGLQSLRWNNSLSLYTSVQMRDLLKNTGWAQGTGLSGNIGPFPNVAKAILQLGIGATDCNANSLPDLCDIAAGTSQDCNGNGVPDECEGGAVCCLPDGSCDVWTESCCAQAGGTFLSQQTFCKTTQRACCRPPPYEDCVVTTAPCCDAVGGTFKELILTCGFATCPSYNGPSLEP